MKNLINYYSLIFIPFALLIIGIKTEFLSIGQFLVLFIFYALPYRGVTDYYRLRSKNVINKNQYLIILIPGSRIRYFRELYFI